MSLFLIAITFLVYTIKCEYNDVPVIGILTVPCLPQVIRKDCPIWAVPNATSYMAASYVKFLEAGGAKIIPILSTDNLKDVSELVLQLNGVLFTGGTEYFNSSSIYWNQVNNILDTLRKYHSENPSKSIPLWATCLGFEALVCATAKEGPSIMRSGYDDFHATENISFTSYSKKSKLFNSTMPYSYSNEVYNKLSTQQITSNDHNDGFNPKEFLDDKYLDGNFSIIGNSRATKTGQTFVTLIESKEKLGLSWYGAQFHPEKSQYEFAKPGIHNLDSIFVNQYFAEFFVNECRMKNDIKMDENKLNEAIIYNYNPYFVDKYGESSFEQNYIFV